jgi:hypothetical protein
MPSPPRPTKDWKNRPNTSTPISAEALEDLEERGYEYAEDVAASATAEEADAREAADEALDAAVDAAQEQADAALPRAGGTMTGPIVLDGDPIANLHPATRQYVLAQIAALIDGAPGALDTLKELADLLGSEDDAVVALTAVVLGKLTAAANLGDLVDAVEARGNLGLGSAAVHPVEDFDAAGAADAVQSALTAAVATIDGALDLKQDAATAATEDDLNAEAEARTVADQGLLAGINSKLDADDPSVTNQRVPTVGALLTLLQGKWRRVHVNGHSAAQGSGSSGGIATSAGGRLAGTLLHSKQSSRALGGSVLGWDGCEVDPQANTNINSGAGGYARALKDLGQPGISTLVTGITASATTLQTAGTTAPFPAPFTPPAPLTVPANAFVIRIDAEELLCTLADGASWNVTRTLTVVRGWNNTTPAAHGAGAEVIQVMSAKGGKNLSASALCPVEQVTRPFLPWFVSGSPVNQGDVLPFFWWDLNDLAANCATTWGGVSYPSNSIANYAQAQRSYVHAYRRVISRARSSFHWENESFAVAAVAAGAEPVQLGGYGGVWGVTGNAGDVGHWTSAINIDANYIRRCSGNGYFATNTVGEFIEYRTFTDLSQDQAVAFGFIAQAGDAGTITFTMDGVTVGTINIQDAAPATSGKTCGFCFRFTEALAQAHGMSIVDQSRTLRATLTAKTAGTYAFRLDGIDIEAGTGSPVMVAAGIRPAVGSGVYGFATDQADQDAKIDVQRANIAGPSYDGAGGLIAEFAPYSGLPNPVLFVDVDTALNGRDASLRSTDFLHPNNAGYNKIASAAFATLFNYMAAARDADALMAA